MRYLFWRFQAIFIIFLSCILFLSCQRSKEVKEAKEKELRYNSIVPKLSQLVTEFNAVTDWGKAFISKQERYPFQGIYTIELDQAIVRPDKRPILFYCDLNDLFKKGEQYFVRFRTDFDSLDTPEIYLELISDKEQCDELLRGDTLTDFLPHIAVVAQVEAIRKIKFEISAFAAESKYGETEIYVDSPDIFIATGKCLGFLQVGDVRLP